MQPVVTSEFIKSAELKTIEEIGLSSEILMENAGRKIAQFILENHEPGDSSITIICGKGNNGGDGMVVGRILAEHGFRVSIIILYKPTSLSKDAFQQFQILTKLTEIDEDLPLTISCFDEPSKIWELNPSNIVIDAILGTGATRNELPPVIATSIEWMNSSNALIYSVDIPTGLDPNNGLITTGCVQADRTFCLGAIKLGLLINDGPMFSGAIEICEIGIPGKLLGETDIFLNSLENVRYGFPVKFETMHKYQSGHVIVVAGSKGMHGAAVLTAEAAIKSGAGIVTLITAHDCYVPIASQLKEVMVHSVDYNANIFEDEKILSLFSKADAIVLGPGLGRDLKTQEMVRLIISESEVPVILDADGLFAFIDKPGELSKSRAPLILTPHLGEFSRLVNQDTETLIADLLGSVKTFSKEIGHTVLVKGRHSMIVSPNGQVMINPTGNPGMATAGSGDVLSGIIGAMTAQGVYPDRAASSSAFLHGRAGDIASEIHTQFGMTAFHIVELISAALSEISDE